MNELLTKCLTVGNVAKLSAIPRQLLNPVEAKWVSWIREFAIRYGEPPTLARFMAEHKTFIKVESADPLEDVWDRTMVRKRNSHFIERVNLSQADLRAGLDPKPMIDSMHEVYRQATGNYVSTTNVDRSDYFEPKKIYKLGVPFLDDSIGGIAFGDYVLFVGRPGSYKTTFVESVLVGLSLSGIRCLYISNENSADEVKVKLDAHFWGFNPVNYRTGVWPERAKDRVKTGSYLASVLDGEIVVPLNAAGCVADVADMIEEHKPELVFIDGVYLMNDDSGRGTGWESMTAVSRELKRLARARKIPILGTIQAGRGAEDKMVSRDTIALTDAFLQDGDTIISINRIGNQFVGTVVKSRWGPTLSSRTFEIKVNFDQMLVSTVGTESAVLVEESEW